MARFITAGGLMLVIACAASVAIAGDRSADDRESVDWAEIYQDDIQAARRIILDSHPGPVDSLNPGFGDWLEAGFEQQMALAESVDTVDEYVYAMQKFIGGFRDGHLNIRFEVDSGPARWPGFFATWRNDAVVVYNADAALAADLTAGDRLQTCDGQTAERLVRNRVFDFQYDPAVPAYWVRAAARAFVDLGNPFVNIPRRCVFVHGDREIALELEWRELSREDRWDEYNAASGRTSPEVGLYMPEAGVYWLQASTFGPDKAQTERYHDAFRQLRAARSAAKLVVLDLRGNNGGSSMWADLFAEALWDELPDAGETAATYVEWRVSSGNVEHWKVLPEMLREQFGNAHSAYRWSMHVLRHLEAALREGQVLWRETPVDDEQDSKGTPTDDHAGEKMPAYRGTVAVLTDTNCASACLDAMSLLAAAPGVVHLGSVTSADTQYMEARTVKLPSALATLVIPIKVYRGRARPDGGYYTPAFEFEGLQWTDEALRSWVLGLWHEGDLAASAHAR